MPMDRKRPTIPLLPSLKAAATGQQRVQPSVTAYLPAGDVCTVYGSGSSHRKGSRPRGCGGCRRASSASPSGTAVLSPAALAAAARPFSSCADSQPEAIHAVTDDSSVDFLSPLSDVVSEQLWATFSLSVTGPWRAAGDLQRPKTAETAERRCRGGGGARAEAACPASVPTPHHCHLQCCGGLASPADPPLKKSQCSSGGETPELDGAIMLPGISLMKAVSDQKTGTDGSLQSVTPSKESSDRDFASILLTSRNRTRSSSIETPPPQGELSTDDDNSFQDLRLLSRKMWREKKVSFSEELQH
ncbi:hypothetical protein STCU_09926 [Strigomonas culicis]|uniref:Uncharacterized protein n=1 Tax=Strigomonas culicis TaxID=28005 RepID=S9V679_9TRYP|nr:hypothetical protein STCU_09926 [Strigomonas culicis]|eukprot:EPY18420.1 hypothetical protein STCU_09926 [Strigomonas culicis]